MKDNKGFSLVELLIAMAIGAVVSASIAYLLVTSMRMYGNETANAVLQQELQSSLNMIRDCAMESQTLVIVHDGSGKLVYLMLGSEDSTVSTAMNVQFFWPEEITTGGKTEKKLYMAKGQIANYRNFLKLGVPNLMSKGEDAAYTPVTGKSTFGTSSATEKSNEEKKAYLLADYLDEFDVKADESSFSSENLPQRNDEGVIENVTWHYYENPVSLEITLKFKKQSGIKEIKKDVTERVVLRNQLNTPLVIDGAVRVPKNRLDQYYTAPN